MRLTELLRPQHLNDFVGQTHLLFPHSPLRRLIDKEILGHSFFFGPPGCGKTSFARLLSHLLKRDFYELNATSLKIEEIRTIVSRHKGALTQPLIFIDEIHRLSKTQQEVLLPIMEKNEALIVGASTENPFFSLTGGIRSRSFVYEFKRLSCDELSQLLVNAQTYYNILLEDEAKAYLLSSSNGDARQMLSLLEAANENSLPITVETLKFFRPFSLSDSVSSDDTHYDLASALIKSIRGSDPDAAIYWLARLIHGGESCDFIARRLVILASEDIGNANPDALVLANACLQTVVKIGYPEARISLSQTAIYLACSPKSNSAYLAIDNALSAIKEGLNFPVPDHLRDSHTLSSKNKTQNYRYPHDFGGWVKQDYLPQKQTFVELKPIAFEGRLGEWLTKIRSNE